MNKIHKRRLIYVALFAISLSLVVSLILYALKKNINVFLTPSQLISMTTPANYHFRLGGIVKPHSLEHEKNSLNLKFIVTDYKHDVIVEYSGIPPDLFREGKGVIVEGNLNSQGLFIATQVLAKHDENYMPKSTYQALRKNALEENKT